MKLLVFSSYLTIPDLPGFNKNQSGFGYMVAAITLGLGKFKNLDIDVLTQSNFTSGANYGAINFLKRTPAKLLSFFSIRTLIHAFKEKSRYNNSDFKRQLLYTCTSNYFKSIVKNYDVVHIHGISSYTFEIIDYCIKNNIKAVVTIHGVNYLNESISISDFQRKKEQLFIQNIINSNTTTLTVISKGIKNRIKESLPVNSHSIEVIQNFHDFTEEYVFDKQDIRKQYNIPDSAKIILSIGNYSINKNQKQLTDIFEELNSDDTYLLLLGTGTEELNNHIDSYQSKNRIILCGHIDKNLLPNYYLHSNILAVTSISEGFGLPMTEALSFGLPVITFEDIDSVSDIFENNNLFLVPNRISSNYAKCLKNALNQNPNKELLKNSVRKFSPDIILNQYKSILCNSITK
jgi:glycosyltransferase involved in cell wall biosynthesis